MPVASAARSPTLACRPTRGWGISSTRLRAIIPRRIDSRNFHPACRLNAPKKLALFRPGVSLDTPFGDHAPRKEYWIYPRMRKGRLLRSERERAERQAAAAGDSPPPAGVFGLLQGMTTQSTREIGIRMALGATPGQDPAKVPPPGCCPALVGYGYRVSGRLRGK